MEINFCRGHGAAGKETAAAWSGPGMGWDFLLLRTISNFTYEIVKSLGEIAMDGNFRKKGHGCHFFSTR